MATRPALHHDRRHRRLYATVALVAALVAFAGFAPTYYLKGLFGTPPLSALVHVHGLVMTLWIALFVAQVSLVGAGRVDLHRRLGIAGAVLALLVIAVGTQTAIEAARLGVSPGPPPLVFLAIPLGVVVVFAMLVATALYVRKRSDFHKRLMLIATLSLLTPAIARLPGLHDGGPLVAFGLTDLLLLACVTYDTVKNRRLHPAFIWGGLLLIVSQPLRIALAFTPGWMQFATWLTG